MKYAKGETGNAGGRPRKTDEQRNFERKCREWADLFALDKLKRAADSKKPMESIAAVKEICDRGFGKSEAISYAEVNVTEPTGIAIEEIEGEIASILGEGEGENICDPGPDKVDPGA